MRFTIALLIFTWTLAVARAGDSDSPRGSQPLQPLRPSGELLEIEPDAYGPGISSDQYGRPHVYRTPDGAPLPAPFTGGVKRDAYGLGVHADEFGRPLVDGEP
jgi:hypothetical protein